ncbi:MAG: hypothetical protein AB8D78_13785 [Akkermansiaceae bacterium]
MKSYTQITNRLKSRCEPVQKFTKTAVEKSRPALKTAKRYYQKADKMLQPLVSPCADFIEEKSQPALNLWKKMVKDCPPFSYYLKGPYRLVTAQFNRRNAIFMIALCIPALSLFLLLTLPGVLFVTPQHNEYFEFAKQLDQGGARWVAMTLATCCSILALAMPCEDYQTRQPDEA